MANDLAPCLSSSPPSCDLRLDTLDACKAHEVWAGNLDVELNSFLAAVAAAGPKGVVAFDTEFPGTVREVPQFASNEIQYKAVRVNVQLLTPIQMGFAVADGSGQVLGVWNFNLRFDATKDLHLESALKFLTSAGVDFRRHAREGIDCEKIGERMGASLRALCDWSREDALDSVGPCWVTFSGLHDLGYLLKVLEKPGRSPPSSMASFEEALNAFCPHRCELKELLPPYGSLESWVQELNVPRVGRAHTAGSDALATLMVFLCVGKGDRQKVPGDGFAGPRLAERPPSTGTDPRGRDEAGKREQIFAHAFGAALTSQTGAHAASLLIKCA